MSVAGKKLSNSIGAASYVIPKHKRSLTSSLPSFTKPKPRITEAKNK